MYNIKKHIKMSINSSKNIILDSKTNEFMCGTGIFTHCLSWSELPLSSTFTIVLTSTSQIMCEM